MFKFERNAHCQTLMPNELIVDVQNSTLMVIALADLSNYQPTQFQPVGLCKKSTGNQPRSYPSIGPPTGDGWFS